MVQRRDFDSAVLRPSGLEIAAIHRSVDFIEQHLADPDFIDLYLEQANIFSAVVGMFGTKALDHATMPSSRTTTMLAGTSCGGTSLILPRPSSVTGR